ncbi:hypothetical protein [Uliginosibacterium sediminicola]|uniref:Uncharacterized protein n=1 Tax=Uliginosibacterium sediminicola TaxID=2024550 RepID=A0ABU9YWD8_9RHOO
MSNHAELLAMIERAAHEGDFGDNDRRTPTPAMCEAGNYKKGRLRLYGLPLAIEQPRNSIRRGTDKNGQAWESRMGAHYGDIEGTRGADGDPVDVFVGTWPLADTAYVINQYVDGQFDEHKVMLAFVDEAAARAAYLASYERGWPGLDSLTPVSIPQLKWWLRRGDMSRPLTANQLPHEGQTMNRTFWNSQAEPINTTLDRLLYDVRRDDGSDGLLLDACTAADIIADADGGILVLDAMVVQFARLPRQMEILKKVMERTPGAVKPLGLQVTEPFTQRGVANVAAIFELSDGQTLSIYFHNPDVTPKKMAPGDELISWKWLLNKKDVTIVVAPERGQELNVREVARRVLKLAEKNSAAFARANANRAARMENIASLKSEVAALETELASAQHELEVAQQEAVDRQAAKDKAAAEVSIEEVAAAMDKTRGWSAWWSDEAINATINQAAVQGWVRRPSTSQVEWTDKGIAAYRAWKDAQPTLADAAKVAVETALSELGATREEWQVGATEGFELIAANYSGSALSIRVDQAGNVLIMAGGGREESAPSDPVQIAQAIKDLVAPPAVAEDQSPFRHMGLQISIRNVKDADGTVKTRWTVQTPENMEREQRGERQIGGDSIVDSREAAINEAEFLIRQDEERKKRIAEADAAEEADRAAKAAIVERFAEFVAYKGYSPAVAEKARAALMTMYASGKRMYELVADLVAEGRFIGEYGGRRTLENSEGYMLEEKKVGKVGMDYAEWLIGKRDQMISDTSAPIASLTGTELGDFPDTPEGKKALREAAKALLYGMRGDMVPCPAIGREVEIRRRSIKETLAFSADPRKLKLIPAIKEMIGSAVLEYREDNHKLDKKPGVATYYRLATTVMLEAAPLRVSVVIAEDRDGTLYYDFMINRDAAAERTTALDSSSAAEVPSSPLNDNSKNPGDLNVGQQDESVNVFDSADEGPMVFNLFIEGEAPEVLDDESPAPAVPSAQFERYADFIREKAGVVGNGMIQEIKVDPGFEDGEAEKLLALIAELNPEGKQPANQDDVLAAIKALRPFLSKAQMSVMGTATRGEEGQWFKDKFVELAELIKTMPRSYGQDGKGDQALAYLHYFTGGSDFWITELDSEGDGTEQAFGLAKIQVAKLGYISIAEIVAAGAELDLHWTPKTLAEINGSEGDQGDDDEKMEAIRRQLDDEKTWVSQGDFSPDSVAESRSPAVLRYLSENTGEAESHAAELSRLWAERANTQPVEPQPVPQPVNDGRVEGSATDPHAVDRALFQSVIDGTVPDMLAPELADQLEAAYARIAGDAELESLFERAVNAYTSSAMKSTDSLAVA